MYCRICSQPQEKVTRIEQLPSANYYDERRTYHCFHCYNTYTRDWRTVCDGCGSTADKLTQHLHNHDGSPRLLCRQCEDSV